MMCSLEEWGESAGTETQAFREINLTDIKTTSVHTFVGGRLKCQTSNEKVAMIKPWIAKRHGKGFKKKRQHIEENLYGIHWLQLQYWDSCWIVAWKSVKYWELVTQAPVLKYLCDKQKRNSLGSWKCHRTNCFILLATFCYMHIKKHSVRWGIFNFWGAVGDFVASEPLHAPNFSRLAPQ